MPTMQRAWLGGLVVAGLSVWLGAGSGHAQPSPSRTPGQVDRLQGFSTVVINHVNDGMGTEMLPVADGDGVEAGVLVTLDLNKMQIYDQDVAVLRDGRVVDETIAAECRSDCPAAFYDAFQRNWLTAAVESTAFAVEVPARVLFAVNRELPAATLLQAAYAAAETRPVQLPQLALLVNNTRGSLRALPFFLVPPRGLELRQGSAALGLTIKVAPGQYHVSASDPRYAREHRAAGLPQLRALAREIKKHYPSKETVILVPEGGVTVRELIEVSMAVRDAFPRVVLSGGQELRTP